MEVFQASKPAFMAPDMQPTQFLLITSPSEAKIVWTPLVNFQSSKGRSFALVDSGLVAPKGLAFDKQNGHLYVADSGAQKIFRYTLLVQTEGGEYKLTTTGVRLTISEGHPVEWVAVDDVGNVFYTATDTNNINKITTEVMEKLATGLFDVKELQVKSEKTLEAQSATEAAAALSSKSNESDATPTDAPTVEPYIYSIYEAELNPHVSAPGSIMVDGPDLYWTNQADAKTSGTVVKGEVNPKPETTLSGPVAYPAVAITNYTDGAMGMAKTGTLLFYTANSTDSENGLVEAMMLEGGTVLDLVDSLAGPRGLAWDGDQTVYVADTVGGAVYSFPAGRLMGNAPITKTVDIKGAYGLAILSEADECFHSNQVSTLDRGNPDAVRQEVSQGVTQDVSMMSNANKFSIMSLFDMSFLNQRIGWT